MEKENKYKPTAPARHAALVLWRNFEFQPSGRVAATQSNIAALIDYGTRTPHVVNAFKQLYDGLRWTKLEDLESNIDRIRDGVRGLEEVGQTAPCNGRGITTPNQASEAAWTAARALTQNFRIITRTGGRIKATLNNIAVIIDVSTDIQRLQKAIGHLATTVMPMSKYELANNLPLLRGAIYLADIARRHAPAQSADEEETESKPAPVAPKISDEQQQRLQLIARRLAGARTVAEEQTILRQT